MEIIISNSSDKPIYEQISSQIKNAILSGELSTGQALPSKRAYSDLETLGFIETRQGKGSFVAGGNLELLREEQLRHIESLLQKALREAGTASVSLSELHDILDTLAES